VGKRFAPDDLLHIQSEINELLLLGSECVLVSGGMSVDPDDLTPTAIAAIADEIITYGSPVLPGAMFMLAYKDALPILGIPACGMFNKITVLDLILPYIFTQEKITSKIINNKAHGGLCLKCETCIYPHCEFGKG
jgi:molybdopterin biosynthesis enzyme